MQAVGYHARTAFLFTKSDFKTTIVPITVFATVAAPIYSLDRLPHIVFWIWLHLLQFNVSNQTFSVDEDRLNKADRPLPAGRITLSQAWVLRWALVPLCFALSLSYSARVLYASATFITLTCIYNELHVHASHGIVRNVMNALGFASMEAGATLVAAYDRSHLDSIAVLAVCLSGAMFASTYHVQDFKDIEGDRLVGRRTLPIMFPTLSRQSVVVGLLAWSVALAVIWNLDVLAACVLLCLGATVGVRFLLYRTVPEDQVSFYLYNVWISFAHALPAYWRFML